MKREDIVRKRDEAKRLLNRFLIVHLVFLSVLIAAMGALRSPQRTWIDNVGMAVGVAGAFAGILWIGRKTDLKCPACGRSIQGNTYARLALTTGKCGHCGNVIIDETEAESGSQKPPAFTPTTPGMGTRGFEERPEIR